MNADVEKQEEKLRHNKELGELERKKKRDEHENQQKLESLLRTKEEEELKADLKERNQEIEAQRQQLQLESERKAQFGRHEEALRKGEERKLDLMHDLKESEVAYETRKLEQQTKFDDLFKTAELEKTTQQHEYQLQAEKSKDEQAHRHRDEAATLDMKLKEKSQLFEQDIRKSEVLERLEMDRKFHERAAVRMEMDGGQKLTIANNANPELLAQLHRMGLSFTPAIKSAEDSTGKPMKSKQKRK